MEGLTAKVFRTYNASYTLQKELDKWPEAIDESSMVEEKKKFYNDANRQVAILCNHQKTVNKNTGESLKQSEIQLSELEKYIGELKAHRDALHKSKKTKADREETITLYKKSNGQDKTLVKKFPGSLDKCVALV